MRFNHILRILLLGVLLMSELVLGYEISYWSEISSNFATMTSYFFYLVMIMFDVALLWNFFSDLAKQ